MTIDFARRLFSFDESLPAANAWTRVVRPVPAAAVRIRRNSNSNSLKIERDKK